MKKFWNWGPVLLAGFFIGNSALLTGCSFDREKSKNIIVVQVNDKSLDSESFAKELSQRLKTYDILSARDDQFVAQAKQSIIHEFLHQHIVNTWAEKNNIQISKEELEKEFQNIRSQYPDDISFRESFAEENLKMEDWLKKLKLKLLEKKLQESITAKVEKPSDSEARSFYKENKSRFKIKQAIKIRQIVTENRLEGERIRKKVRRGQNFEELAKKYSISPDASNGGHTGWIEKSTMDVFDKAFSLRRGATSPIWESPYGHHIIQVLKTRSARQLAYSDVKDQIIQEIFEDRKQATYTAWIDKQVKSLKVLINEEALQAIKVDVNIQ
jgi:parvulin-like peptidyl-prolyl isomerase